MHIVLVIGAEFIVELGTFSQWTVQKAESGNPCPQYEISCPIANVPINIEPNSSGHYAFNNLLVWTSGAVDVRRQF